MKCVTNSAKNKGGKTITTRSWRPETPHVLEVPICTEYKYLGTFFNSKLTATPQIHFIKRKSAFLYTKLFPYLKNASMDGRRDMFSTFIMPLFEATHVLLAHEPSKVHRMQLIRTQRTIFKQFLRISKRTNSVLVEDMIRKNLAEISKKTVQIG